MELVAGAFGNLIPKLKDLLKEEYKLQKGVKDQIRSLEKELESAHATLREVANMASPQLNEVGKIWVHEIRAASYDMEDILDTYLVHIDGSSNPNELDSSLKRLGEKISRLFKKSSEHHKIAGAIKKIKKNLQEVTERRGRYTADSIVAKSATSSWTVDPRLTAMYKEASQIIGIDKSIADLISMLLPKEDHECHKKMKIVSVVGVGGLGKTTLAKAVYDQLKSQFGYGAFVPVGQDPDVKKVFRDILIDLDKAKYTDFKYTMLDERQLINELHDFLQPKRYFIIIDDIWEPQTWEIIKLFLVDNNLGSRIITTTRKFQVANEADEVYKLQTLSHDYSKKLFYMRLFGHEDNCPNTHLDELSSAILKKCGGVPLAIITMASLLLGKSREEWIEVCNSPGFYRDKDERHMENTMYILSLSYNDLPSHLKTCLLYLCIFPEDSLIQKDSLIWKWIGEGFVKKKPGCGLFEVGEEYFHELINRSMIQGVDSEVYGIMEGCRVHDMVLDLIVSKSNEENFVSSDGTLSQSQKRRLATKSRELDLTQDTDVNLPQLRSFLLLQCDIAKWAIHPRFKVIRVLALESCKFREGCHNLQHIGNLHHLRYLGIRDTWIPELPEEIGALKFLQTLELVETGIKELPCNICMLTKLVCLHAKQIITPDGVIGRLTSLVDLQIAGPRDNYNSIRQFMKDLGNLDELKVLKIRSNSSTQMDEGTQTELMHSLGSLQKMQHLTLGDAMDSVLMNAWDAAVTCRYLRCLFLPYIKFPKLPSWINSVHLPSLSHLVIHVDDVDELGLKALGRLPVLCYLKLITRGTITCNTEADGCFQKLRSLVLPYSLVQSVANEDSSTSLNICFIRGGTAMVRRRLNVPTMVMPNLEELQFTVSVKKLKENNVSCADLGLDNFPSIRKVKVQFYCRGAYARDVGRACASLRHAVQVHPNRPSLQIE